MVVAVVEDLVVADTAEVDVKPNSADIVDVPVGEHIDYPEQWC